MRPASLPASFRFGAPWTWGTTTIVWMLVAWVVVFWRLGYLGLLDPDEAHYAQMTREMMRGRSWLVPILDGSPFIDKPILFHWLQAASIALFGGSELALRLPSALAAMCLICTVWWVAMQCSGRRIAERSALMFVTMPATFALSSVGLFDMVFAAFLFGGLASVLVSASKQRPWLQFAGYALLAVAVMIKGPVALVLVVLLFVAAWGLMRNGRVVIDRLHWPSGLALIGLISLPWFVWMSVTFGDRFVRDYLLAGNIWYFTRPSQFSTRNSDWFFYARTFFGAFFPWSLIALGGAVDGLRGWRRGDGVHELSAWLWLWLAVVGLFFTAAGFKLDTYLFPAAPACAILAAIAWDRAVAMPGQIFTRVSVLLVAGIMAVGGTFALVALFYINLNLGAWTAALPLVCVFGGVALLWQMGRRQWRVPQSSMSLVGTLVIAFAVIVHLGFPLLESSRPTRPLGRWVAAHSARGIAVGSYGLDDWTASIRYYSDRPVERLRTFDDVLRFFEANPTAKALMVYPDYRAMRDAGLDLEAVAARRAIVGRSGKFLRRQIWGQLVVVTRRDYAASLVRGDWDLQ